MDTMKTMTRWSVAAAALAALMFGLATDAQAKQAPTDLAIEDAVEDEILFDPMVSTIPLDVDVQEGVVTLSGTVDNVLDRERAERLAMTVKGVRSVVNTIEVDPVVRTDEQIKEAVQEQLLLDPATDSYEVDIAVAAGAVTLTGTVDSWQERELSRRVAMGVSGVRSVDASGIHVEFDTNRPDREIRDDIQQALRWNVHVPDETVAVSVTDGAVALEGTVPSAAAKHVARRLAWVSGVQDVDLSGLLVRTDDSSEMISTPTAADLPDEAVADAVRDALLYDPRVASFEVAVDVDDGLATLRGTVDNLKAKRAAENTARRTRGVWMVENRLRVSPDDERTDMMIATDVRNALLRDPYVESEEVTVIAANDTVTLTGTVDSLFEKMQAEDLATRVNGVRHVENRLAIVDEAVIVTVDPAVDAWDLYDFDWYTRPVLVSVIETDAEIRKDIRDHLYWNPFVPSTAIDVKVEDGVATLSGTVSDWVAWREAREEAYEGGALKVKNLLLVRSPEETAAATTPTSGT